jgi:tRNA dimethylallyltransferase
MSEQDGKPRVLVLAGPTASGKTAVSLRLAAVLGGEIISADSRQIFRRLDIGTAKPTPAERAGVPHHLIDVRSPGEPYNAALYGVEARRAAADILARDHIPIVVGGSGLYVQAFVDGLFEGPGADAGFRARAEERIADGEFPALLEELRAIDPVAAARIDPTKPRRVIRALEVYHVTGTPMSRFHDAPRPDPPFHAVQFGLLWERQELYRRINERCDAMISAGLIEETRALAAEGFDASFNALNSVGYREALSFLRGQIDREEMLRLFRQNSRRYAKRQMTWFRRDPRIRWIPAGRGGEEGETARRIASLFRVKERPA